MRILLAPDSFKEAASAEAIAQAMARGIKRGDPQAECRLLPLSDGGEGLTHALVHATGGTLHDVETVDAVGRPILRSSGFLAIIMLLVFSTPPWSNWLRQADLNGSPLPTVIQWLHPRLAQAC